MQSFGVSVFGGEGAAEEHREELGLAFSGSSLEADKKLSESTEKRRRRKKKKMRVESCPAKGVLTDAAAADGTLNTPAQDFFSSFLVSLCVLCTERKRKKKIRGNKREGKNSDDEWPVAGSVFVQSVKQAGSQ